MDYANKKENKRWKVICSDARGEREKKNDKCSEERKM